MPKGQGYVADEAEAVRRRRGAATNYNYMTKEVGCRRGVSLGCEGNKLRGADGPMLVCKLAKVNK